METPILLAAVNARYSHTGLGARFLLANMGNLRANTDLIEFAIDERVEAVADRIAELDPIAFGPQR